MLAQAYTQMDPDGLEAYFTDVEHLRALFQQLMTAPMLPKRLLVIHGIGGVGKSSLLRICRLYCKKEQVPVALTSGDEARSAVEVLHRWRTDLEADQVKLPTYAKTAERYRAIGAEVAERVRKAQEGRRDLVGALGKAAAKTIIDTAVSAIPIAGPVASTLGSLSAEALIDWLGGFLKKPDIDLLLDPVQTLTDDFTVDLTKAAAKQRLVLMLDTFEQLSVLDDWTRRLAQGLPPNLLVVIAGREIPNWSRHWPGWLADTEVEELKPMTDQIIRELIGRYYATMHRGQPAATQVEAIITFARGLPLVVTSAVRLWVKYGVEDFQAVKAEVMADLVDRLQEGVQPELVPVLEAASAVRWFNRDILRAVAGQVDINAAYDELRRFPFTRPRPEGLGLHNAVREIIDENLLAQDPSRHRDLHERAAAYFEMQLDQPKAEESESLELERLYHRVLSDESTGMRLFQEMAGGYDAYQLLNRLQGLLNDVNTYPLKLKNSRLCPVL